MSVKELSPPETVNEKQVGYAIRPGYKQTEVGLIPKDWKFDRLERFWSVTDCKHVTAEFVESGYPIASIREVQSRFVDLKYANQTNDYFYKLLIGHGRQPRAGDLILSRNATVGEVAQVADWHPPFAMGQDVCLLRKHDEHFSTTFLQSYFQSDIFARQLADLMVGSTFKRANIEQIKSFKVPMPCPAEQEAIAGALSDADAWIESLEQLIAKKRQIKQGAMQELLTGQTRLPGFNGKWAVKPFASVLSRVNAKSHQIQTNEYQMTGIYPVVDQGKKAVVGFSDKIDKRFGCPAEGVIVFGDHTCIVKFIDFDFLVGADGTQILIAKDGQCTRFHSLQMEYRGVEPTGYNRHFKLLKEREFLTPPIQEQSVIAAVLSDMDAETKALETKLTKARQIKQGMMQELLTGRIRLV